jgi:hypothetical protein
MDMMQVRHVRVTVRHLLMPMPMTVRAYQYLSMDVGMVFVIMSMRVLMLQHLMHMLVFMPF